MAGMVGDWRGWSEIGRVEGVIGGELAGATVLADGRYGGRVGRAGATGRRQRCESEARDRVSEQRRCRL